MPFESTAERSPDGGFGNVGVCAAISHWWFRNEPPKAPWKKLSAIA
jgi:hypothetical protein